MRRDSRWSHDMKHWGDLHATGMFEEAHIAGIIAEKAKIREK